MDSVDVIAVVGSCAPERLRYAKRLAATTGRMFVPASRLAIARDPIQEAAALAPWADMPAGAVVEFPGEASTTDIIGTLASEEEHTRLIGVVCVVDAAHLLDDLRRDDHVGRRAHGRPRQDFTARALLVVTQLEYASTIVFVNWAPLSTAALSTVMAIVSHLSPRARLRLHRDGIEQLEAGTVYAAEQERPGWVGILNGDFDPHMTDPRVSALRYERIRPLHPGRLQHLLDERIEPGEFGTVVRSAGFCRLATRPQVTAQWEQVGQMISFVPFAADDQLTDDEELLALGQDLAFIGLDLAHEALTAALDETVLTDAELAAGPVAWAGFTDPFPAWQTASDRLE